MELLVQPIRFMHSKNFIIFFLLLSYCKSSSQVLEGVVKDAETNKTLEAVHILSSGIKENTISDRSGKFSLELKEETSLGDTIKFSSVGYRIASFTLYDLKQRNGKVLLWPVVDQLQEVNLNPEIVLNKKLRFTKISSLAKGAYSFGSSLVGNKIYVIAGDASFLEDPIKKEMALSLGETSLSKIMSAANRNFSMPKFLEEIQVYDLEKDEWEVLPVTVDQGAGHNVVHHEGRLYIFGGKKLRPSGQKVMLNATVEIFDLERDTVIVDPVYPHQAVHAAAVGYNGDLLVMGGSVRINRRRKKEFTENIHLFNFETGLWFDAGKMTSGKESSAALVGNKIYVIGGNDGNWLNTIESLNLLTGKWKTEARLSHTWKEPSIVSYGKVIYIYEKGKLFTFDVEKKEVTSYLVDLDLIGPVLHVWKEQLFILGGYDEYLYRKKPLDGCYKIDLVEFNKTETQSRIRF